MTIELNQDNPNRESIEWAYNTLVSLGFILKNSVPEKVQDTPWSCVMRFITGQGIIYLKQTPEQLALEAPITQILSAQFQAPVPDVIAYGPTLRPLR